jgi:DNA-binding NtrC family response regulator/tetratricopeptide (TPR) repeat protein
VHPALGSTSGLAPLAGARLTDRQRAAVLLQAAGLLSLLERAGWRLADLDAARLASGGRLAVPLDALEPGREPRPVQEILRDLAARLFAQPLDEGLPGRGEARRALRSLLERWKPALVPLPPDDAVAQLLDTAVFLWDEPFAPARRALAGEVSGDLWVAGPRPFRALLLRRSHGLDDLHAQLENGEVRSLWSRMEEGEEGIDPRDLAAAGRWRAAVDAWRRRPPAAAADDHDDGERVELARALSALGRFEAALGTLEGLRTVPAETVRAWCQALLLQGGAARATLRRLEPLRLSPDEAVDLAEIAARVLANGGEAERAVRWVRRAVRLAGKQGETALRAWIVAAEAAWDRNDFETMDEWLERSREAADHPGLAWRWHHVRALYALGAPHGATTAARHLGLAIRHGRRRLPRHRAAGLWNDLGLARAGAGDLAGAERAFLHALRGFEGCDGPRRTALALHNLAEIRLRRGRLAGVREILEQATTEDRRAGNARALAQDAGLWARYELVLGRPAAALALCRDALADLDRRKLDWHRSDLHLLAARALGWLGRPAEADAELSRTLHESFAQLEAEERPAVLALAGDRESAWREAEETPFADLWRAALAGAPPPAPAWEPLAGLDPYRAARLVFDLETIAPGAAPAPWLRSAAATLRAIGAAAPAARLEARDGGAWTALATYLSGPADPAALAELLVHVDGNEGAARAVRALAERDLSPASPASPPSSPPGPAAREPEARAGEEMLGESPLLRTALDRLHRLAVTDLPLLILGESGTGKELAARAVHRASPRRRHAFVAINCAALSETLILSDLFGHVRGAFTGADRERKGVFESAESGTVFLDEIGDLPLTAQSLLLRVLQEGEIRRLGETQPRRVDVRIVAATHRDLPEMVEQGSFRRDLLFRLKVGNVLLPPLRDRGGDVLRLAERFLSHSSAPNGRFGREARDRLLSHTWPGNIRELRNVVLAAAALAGDAEIRPEHLDLPHEQRAAGSPYQAQIEAFRRGLIRDTLAVCGGNRAKASRQLGLSRQTLSYLIRRLGLG